MRELYLGIAGMLAAALAPGAPIFMGDWLELIDTSKLPVLRDDVCLQVSSYDRTGGNDDGFSGTYSYLRQEADGAYVIFEDEGPGCVYRIWSANPGPRRIEFYFDGEATPRLAFDKWEDMFLDKVEPFLSPVSRHVIGGWCSYVPLPYRESLKIVTRERVNFHQITYMKSARGEDVRSFTPSLSDEDRAKFERVRDAWNNLGRHPWPDPNARGQYQKWAVPPGRYQTIAQRFGPGILTGLELAFRELPEKALRRAVLMVNVDGGRRAVEAPLGDFFLQGFPGQNTQSLLCGRKPGEPNTLYAFWPMPFRESIEIALLNESSDYLRLTITTTTRYLRELPADHGYFHAKWLRQNPTVPGENFPILTAVGRGHWCGVSMAMQGFGPGHGYLEGDEMLWIDDRDHTHFNGTGSEDYYNGGWYFGGTGSFPYYGCGYHAEAEGRCHAFRLHMTDLVPFQGMAHIGIEHGHANEVEADYAGTTFWYAEAPTLHQTAMEGAPPVFKRVWTSPRLAGYIEAEDIIVRDWPYALLSDFDTPHFFSSGDVAVVPGGGGRARFAIPVEQDDVCQVRLRIGDGSPGLELVAQLDDRPPALLNWKRDARATEWDRSLPHMGLARGKHVLEVIAPRGDVYLDAFRIVPSEKASGVIEAEGLLARPVGDAALHVVDLEPAGMSGLSGGAIAHGGPGSGAAFGWRLDTPHAYVVSARLHHGPERPTVQFTLDGVPFGEPIACATDEPHWETATRITPPVEPGVRVFGLVIAPGASASNETVVDYLRIVPEGVFEGEELPILEATPPVARRQDMRAFGKQWSRDAQLWFTPPSSDASITFESRLERPGPRNICAFFTKAPDYGVYQLLVDDAPVGEPFDGFHGGVARSERVCFGVHEFDEGAHRITFRCVGKNEQSSNYMLGLDVLELALP